MISDESLIKIGHALMIGEVALEASGLADESWTKKLREARELILEEELLREHLSLPISVISPNRV